MLDKERHCLHNLVCFLALRNPTWPVLVYLRRSKRFKNYLPSAYKLNIFSRCFNWIHRWWFICVHGQAWSRSSTSCGHSELMNCSKTVIVKMRQQRSFSMPRQCRYLLNRLLAFIVRRTVLCEELCNFLIAACLIFSCLWERGPILRSITKVYRLKTRTKDNDCNNDWIQAIT